MSGVFKNIPPLIGAWQAVTKPAAFPFTPPFDVQRKGSLIYRVDPSFSLTTYAGITVVSEGYVDSEEGNDAYAGTIGAPVRTLTEANSRGWDRIYVKRGSVFQWNQCPTELSGDKWVEDYGTGDKPKITSFLNNQVGTFTKTNNYWSASIGDYAQGVTDEAVLTDKGIPTVYEQKASIAEVNDTPGSFYWNANTIYIRTINNRPPDDDIKYYAPIALRLRQDNTTQLFINIEFKGSTQWLANSITGGTKALFKGCNWTMGNPLFHGCQPAIMQECGFYILAGDAINNDDRVGVQGQVIEIDVYATNYGNGDTSSQCSTSHNTCLTIRIGGTYENAAGQCVADVNNSQSWVMGCLIGGSGIGVSSYWEGTFWLEGNQFKEDAISIQIPTAGTVYYRNNLLAGSVDNLGTYTPY